MIISIGDLTIDHYTVSGHKLPGGIATNFAVHIRRSGEDVTLVSAIGNDRFGLELLEQLKREHISTQYIQELAGSTSMQKIKINGHDREFFGFRPGVLSAFRVPQEVLELFSHVSTIFTPLSDGLEDSFEQVINAERGQAQLAVDFSRDADIRGFSHGDVIAMVHHYLDKLDIAMVGGVSEDEEALEAIAQANPEKIIILTAGAKGSMAWHERVRYDQPPQWIADAVDTTGCGDAFRAGFILEYNKNKDMQKGLQAGTALASTVAEYIGAF